MRPNRLNPGQHIVIVVGLGVALYSFGGWVTTRGTGATGWVAYAPLSNTYNTPNLVGGLHSWVRLVIWIFLILVWVIASVALLRSSLPSREGDATE
jgi:heme/copper-type cytochrome/quinol oxidase subunit 1